MSDQREGGIAWTDHTWNALRGCSRVSEGCRHCYAESQAARFSGIDAKGKPMPYHGLVVIGEKGPRWTGKVVLVPERFADPIRWTRPRRIFVNSMSDVFHEDVSNETIAALFGVMAASPQHQFQVLTKRPERMHSWFEWVRGEGNATRVAHHEVRTCALAAARLVGGKAPGAFGPSARGEVPWPLPNVWLGVSVEDQRTAGDRIPLLLDTPAAIRWVSYEPALGPVDFDEWIVRIDHCTSCHEEHPPLGPDRCPACGRGGTLTSTFGERQRRELVEGARYDTPSGDPRADGPELHWIVVGGESGASARPFDLAWARSTVEQCRAAGVAPFVKQLGSKPYERDGDPTKRFLKLSHKKGAVMNEWPESLRVQEYPR